MNEKDIQELNLLKDRFVNIRYKIDEISNKKVKCKEIFINKIE